MPWGVPTQVFKAATARKPLTGQQMRASFGLVDRLLLRETRIKQTIDDGGLEAYLAKARLKNPQPFKWTRDIKTGRMIAPRISLRRQADIGKKAYAEGRFDELITTLTQMNIKRGPKLQKMHERVQQLRSEEARAARAAQASPGGEGAATATTTMATEPVETKQPSKAVKVQVTIRNPKKKRAEAQANAKRLAKEIAATHGPYSGRKMKLIFKGHKAERDAPKRRAAIAAKMKNMKTTVKNYRWAAKKRTYPRGARVPI